jgi:hypothetical protein
MSGCVPNCIACSGQRLDASEQAALREAARFAVSRWSFPDELRKPVTLAAEKLRPTPEHLGGEEG